jgi:hypothetical protein
VAKKIFIFGLVLMLVLTGMVGCSGDSKPSTGKYEILRSAVLGSNWQMYQFRLKMDPGGEFDIDLLDLVPGDKIDGYFFVESGTSATLEIIAGSTTVYKIESTNTPAGKTISDRFSVTASQPLGTAHLLKFTNNGTEKGISVFVEIIYPVSAKIRGPLDIN